MIQRDAIEAVIAFNGTFFTAARRMPGTPVFQKALEVGPAVTETVRRAARQTRAVLQLQL